MENNFYQIQDDIMAIKDRLNWKIFLSTFVAMFIVVSMQYIGVRLPEKILSPLPQANDIFETEVRQKLENHTNAFEVKKPTKIIPEAHAATSANDANAYIVINFDTGEILAEKNLSTPTPIASLTKIMTTIVALDLAEKDELLTVSESAARQIPTKIALLPGQKMTVEELLQAVMLTSANDAAEALRDGIDAKYESEIFIKAMNEKAKYIGLKNTSFENPQGFDSSTNYSTVEDLAILTHYAYAHYPLFAEIVAKDYVFLSANDNHTEHDLYNWNGLIGVYPGAFGVKIGSTGQAGKTTVVAAEREGKKVLAVLLGAPGIRERDMWAAELLDLGFAEGFGLTPITVTEEEFQAKYDSWNY